MWVIGSDGTFRNLAIYLKIQEMKAKNAAENAKMRFKIGMK